MSKINFKLQEENIEEYFYDLGKRNYFKNDYKKIEILKAQIDTFQILKLRLLCNKKI